MHSPFAAKLVKKLKIFLYILLHAAKDAIYKKPTESALFRIFA